MNIFVGCSSTDTDNKYYNKIAEEIGNFIVKGNHNFVVGGGNIGLMGKIHSIVSSNPSSKTIMSLTKLYEDDLKTVSYNQSYIFDTVNENKNNLIQLADIIVFIPGGFGTIDEILSAIETKRKKEHSAPILIANIDNFFTPLLDMFDKVYNEHFSDSNTKELYFVANTIEETLEYLLNLAK